jgi:hypothetical protein
MVCLGYFCCGRGKRGVVLLGGALPVDLALEDPALDADGARGRVGLGEAVVDVSAERVERDAAGLVGLAARHLGAGEAARGGDADALGAELHGGLHGPLEGAAERDAALELLGDVLGDQLGVDLGLADLLDVQEDLGLGEALDSLLELLDAGAALADDDAGARREDVDLQLVGSALHGDVGDAGGVQLLLEEATQQDVFMQPLAVTSVLEPLGAPRADDPDAEADRMCFLAH